MKRSLLNFYIAEAEKFFNDHGFVLPDFAGWSLDDWRQNLPSAGEIVDCGLGWDITDFGSGEYLQCGLLLFTLRNGIIGSERYSKPYAEKIMLVKPGQVTPMHCHFRKQEDIINRGGGDLLFQLMPNIDGAPGKGRVTVHRDGRSFEVEAGEIIRIHPGGSLTLEPGAFHRFWGAEDTGAVMVGEVSSVNDDAADNCFAEKRERFQEAEEDVAPERLTVADYGKFLL